MDAEGYRRTISQTLITHVYRLVTPRLLNTLCAIVGMKAAVVPSVGAKWQVKEIPTPEPSTNQVLIKVHTSGVVIQTPLSQKANIHGQHLSLHHWPRACWRDYFIRRRSDLSQSR